MENIEFERNYENEFVSEEDKFFFEQMVAPGGVFESFQKKMDAIPKMIVPEDKANYEYLLEKCDAFARKHFGRIHGMVDYTHWDAHIDVIVPMLEFCDPEDMGLLKDIGEKAHYLTVDLVEDGRYRVHIRINYFQELITDEYEEYLKVKTLQENEQLAELVEPDLTPEQEALLEIIQGILDRFDDETSVDRNTAFRAVMKLLAQQGGDRTDLEKIAALLTILLETVLDEEKGQEEDT